MILSNRKYDPFIPFTYKFLYAWAIFPLKYRGHGAQINFSKGTKIQS
jgi:hypothetical protein